MSDLPVLPEPEDRLDLDLATTALLARDQDQPALLTMLAEQLATNLGDAVTIRREGGLFKKSDKVKSVEVALANDTFAAAIDKGRVTCSIGHSSGGIRIRSEQCDLDAWIKRLLATLKQEAARSQKVRMALENLVYGGMT
ncbi:MAG TPA: hypothetical protein VFP61_11285 [Acidimicrobiales bacterium]|nr:hypothetical protein [Acidimicrobiales bacterium]